MSLSTIELPQFTLERVRSLQQSYHDSRVIGCSINEFRKTLFKEFERAELARGHAFLSRQQPVTEKVFSGYIEPLRTAQSEEVLTPDLLSSFINQSSAALSTVASDETPTPNSSLVRLAKSSHQDFSSNVADLSPSGLELDDYDEDDYADEFDDYEESIEDSTDTPDATEGYSSDDLDAYEDSFDEYEGNLEDSEGGLDGIEDALEDDLDEYEDTFGDSEDLEESTSEGTQEFVVSTSPVTVAPVASAPVIDTDVVVETFTVTTHPVVESTYEVPTDLRSFIKQNPYCTISDAKRYFSDREIKKQIALGHVILRKGRLSL